MKGKNCITQNTLFTQKKNTYSSICFQMENIRKVGAFWGASPHHPLTLAAFRLQKPAQRSRKTTKSERIGKQSLVLFPFLGIRDQKVAGSNPVTSTSFLVQGVKNLALSFCSHITKRRRLSPPMGAKWVHGVQLAGHGKGAQVFVLRAFFAFILTFPGLRPCP